MHYSTHSCLHKADFRCNAAGSPTRRPIGGQADWLQALFRKTSYLSLTAPFHESIAETETVHDQALRPQSPTFRAVPGPGLQALLGHVDRDEGTLIVGILKKWIRVSYGRLP